MFSLILGCWAEPTPSPSSPATEAVATVDDTQARLQAELRALVAALTEAGRYDCCVEAPCQYCATRTAGCSCGEGLREGEPVCEECAMGWAQGRGAEPGVDPGKVCSFLEADRAIRSAQASGEPCRECGEAVTRQVERLRR